MKNHEIKTKDSRKLTNEDFQKELKIILDNKDDKREMNQSSSLLFFVHKVNHI